MTRRDDRTLAKSRWQAQESVSRWALRPFRVMAGLVPATHDWLAG